MNLATDHLASTPADAQAIQQLLVRYCMAVDDRDWAVFRTCFADDVTADYGAFGRWTDADAMTESMEEAHRRMGMSLHRLTNVLLSGDRSLIKACSYVDLVVQSSKPDRPPRQSYGRYQDEIGRIDGEWKILSRAFVQIDMSAAVGA